VKTLVKIIIPTSIKRPRLSLNLTKDNKGSLDAKMIHISSISFQPHIWPRIFRAGQNCWHYQRNPRNQMARIRLNSFQNDIESVAPFSSGI
jgi:hypothetical protein